MIYYSPFEPTKVTFFENFYDMLLVQYFTSNFVCLLFVSVFFTLYLYFFNMNTFNSLVFHYMMQLYEFIYEMAYDYLNKDMNYYFSFLFYMFLFILFSNLTGMMPLAFSMTSHLSSTISCAFFIWMTVMTMGFAKNKLAFFKMILPKGIPYVLVPFLIFVEFMSYMFSVVSLSLRLFANVLAGHILLHVVSGFMFFMLTFSISGFTVVSFFMGMVLLGLLCMLFAFELMVAMLQSYIFMVLSLMYLQDMNNLSH